MSINDYLLNKIVCGDALDFLTYVETRSVDLILCDLPYGITQNKWDSVIPLDKLWKQYLRVIKYNGAIVLFCNEPFTSNLIQSQLKYFKYKWIWKKNVPSGHLNANIQPLRIYEEIVVFYQKQPTFNKQLRKGKGYNVSTSHGFTTNYGEQPNREIGAPIINDGTTYCPRNIINFPIERSEDKIHPTQKPISLVGYLIKTYTDKGDLVLDNCIGSGTTPKACKLLERNFLACELDKKWCEHAKKRVGTEILTIRKN